MNLIGRLGIWERSFSKGMDKSKDSFSCRMITLVLKIVFQPYYIHEKDES